MSNPKEPLFAVRFLSLRFSHRFALKFNPIGLMNQSIQKRVGNGGVAHQLMPSTYGELAGNDERSASQSIIQDFQQVAVLFRRRRDEP